MKRKTVIYLFLIIILSIALFSISRFRIFDKMAQINSSNNSKPSTSNARDTKKNLKKNKKTNNLKVQKPEKSSSDFSNKHDMILDSISKAKNIEECENVWIDIAKTDYKGQLLGNIERTLLHKMVSIGGYENAKQLIFSKYGSGIARTSLIPILFYDNISIEQCLTRLESLQFPDEKSAAIEGYAALITDLEGFDQFTSMDWTKIATLDADFATDYFARAVRNVLRSTNERIAKEKQSAGIRDSIIKLEAANILNSNNLSHVLNEISNSNSLIAWDSYQSLTPKTKNLVPTLCKEEIIERYVSYDPENAMNSLLDYKSEVNLLESGFVTMLKYDVSAANIWFEKNRSTLDQNQVDYVALAALKHAKSNNDHEVAAKWLLHIHDQNLLEQATKLLK